VLRQLTSETAIAVRNMVASGKTPTAEYIPKRCDRCSLIDLCNPRWLAHGRDVEHWIRKHIED
jgi:CRISPR-associated exonuclease Cas4